MEKKEVIKSYHFYETLRRSLYNNYVISVGESKRASGRPINIYPISKKISEKKFHIPEQSKNYTEKLKKLLREISKKMNRDIKERYDLYAFLNPDCAVSMEGYTDS